MDYNYRAIKFKSHTIVTDIALVEIFDNSVEKENKIIFEGANLFNNYAFYCLNNKIPTNLNTTLFRQCCMLIIDPDVKIGLIKTNFKEPDITDKTADEIIEINKKFNEMKENYKKIGDENNARVEILKNVYNTYFPKKDLEKFKNEKCLTIPIEEFSQTFMANVDNHFVLNYFRFQLRYIQSILNKKLKELELEPEINDFQLSILSRYIQKRINIKEKIDFVCNDKIPNETYQRIKNHIDVIIRTQIKLLTVDRVTYDILGLTPETSMFYKKNCEAILRKTNKDNILKYFSIMSKYLTEQGEKSFSLLPQLSLNFHHITFNKSALSSVYNTWKNKKLTIKQFEKDFDKYFNEMFNIKKKCVRCYKQGYKPKSISTDGFSVSVIFVHKDRIKRPTKSKKKKNDVSEKLNLETINNGDPIKAGLYDADDVICSEEYLAKYHKKGIDTNNDKMIYQVSEADQSTVITKGYYNEISHINSNKTKNEKLIKTTKIDKVFESLAETTRITTNYNDYNKYVLCVRENKNKIWNFYKMNELRRLKYDSYVGKRQAVSTIIRELVPRIRHNDGHVNDIINECIDEHIDEDSEDDSDEIINEDISEFINEHALNYYKRGKKKKHKKDVYFDKEKYEKVRNLPVMIAFGKGNGNLTIDNLKGSSAHGPIKRILKELCKICLVILTDEYKTSQLCSNCHTKMEHIKVIQDISKKKEAKEEKEKERHKGDMNYMTLTERIIRGKYLRKCIKNEKNNEKREILEDELKGLRVEYECYKLCCCKNKECGHKLWHRDNNSPINIRHVMELKLTQKSLGKFERDRI